MEYVIFLLFLLCFILRISNGQIKIKQFGPLDGQTSRHLTPVADLWIFTLPFGFMHALGTV